MPIEPQLPTQQQTNAGPQASFADLLFAALPHRPGEPPAPGAGTEADTTADLRTAYGLPDADTWRVEEEKERGKWGRGKAETDDERAARVEAQRNKADETHARVQTGLQELANALAQGRSEPLVAFLDSLARFHQYSWGNTLLIDLQCPEATLVAGFTTWKQQERQVKAGEKGIAILAPLARRIHTEADEADRGEAQGKAPGGSHNGANGSDAAELRLTGKTGAAGGVWGFKVVYVFDISQTEGKPLPQFATVQGDPACFLPRLRALVSAHGIALAYKEDLNGSLGRSHGGSISLKAGLPPAQEFAVLAHEFAHELLHPLALRAGIAKMVKELEAEAVAYVVGRAAGLEPGTASRDYIHLNQGDAALLAASLDRIQKTATHILAQLETEPEAPPCKAGAPSDL